MTKNSHTPRTPEPPLLAADAALQPREGESGEPDAIGAALIASYLPNLPEGPGVYRMLDAAGNALYVGKARNLKRRVASYTKGSGLVQRIARMVYETRQFEIITTRSEIEALLLEANLIKRLKPRYNVTLRDDKTYPYILLRTDHGFAQVVKHRGAQSIPGHYYGPFASAGAVNRTLNTLQRAFLLRSCSDSVFEARTRPCLLHQIKRCSAPCVGYIDKQKYDTLVAGAEEFLGGKSQALRDALTHDMEAASRDLDFERAATLRDRIRALSHVDAEQGINPLGLQEADVVAIHSEGGSSCVQIFFFRSGQNWGNRAYFPRHDKTAETDEILDAFLSQFYEDKPVPRLILLSEDFSGREWLEAALSEREGRRVEIIVPQRGEKRAIVQSALDNAREAHGRRLAESASQRHLLQGVARIFGLADTPARIEVYDNSHIQGTNAVGGMIVAGPDGLEKAQYRKFNIKDTELTPGDDFGMMREVLTRRFARLVKEEAAGEPVNRPDIVLIDGGLGQLNAACAVLADLGVTGVQLIAIAKGPDRNAGREHFFMPGRDPIMLEPKDPVLYFLQRLRDEAHRFAIGAHRAKRSKALGSSPLDEVPGIGPSRKKALLMHFGTARAVRGASLEDLQKAPGVSAAVAQAVYDFYNPGG